MQGQATIPASKIMFKTKSLPIPTQNQEDLDLKTPLEYNVLIKVYAVIEI